MLSSLSLAPLIGLFLVSAVAVWFGGSRLTGYVDALARKTGIGQAFAGMLLLGGITSLPELAAVSTSAAIGNASIAVNNLLGTASINLVLLAVADCVYGRAALTAHAARPSTLIQGVLSMLLAITVALVVTANDVAIGGVGAGTAVIAAMAAGSIWLASNFERRHVWLAVGAEDAEEAGDNDEQRSIGRLILLIAACGALILAAGFLLSISADAIAEKTGFSTGLIGFLLVGFATSLPELSSIMAAVRLGRDQMAVGDIFGTNIFNVLLIFVADLIYLEGPVLREAGVFEAIGATLAALLTGIFAVGLLERRDRTVFRMGYDSAAVVLCFGVGVFLLSRAPS